MNPLPLLSLLMPYVDGAPLLAQSASLLSRIAPWCAGLLIAAAALGLGAWWLCRRLAAQQDAEPLSMGFSLADLRQLHERGELTDAEYEHAKGRMLVRTRAQLVGEPDSAAARPVDPTAPAVTIQAMDSEGSPPEPDGGIRWEESSQASDTDDGLELGPDFAPDADPDSSR